MDPGDDLGLYLSLGPAGAIERELLGVGGKADLGATTICDELILFSELDFIFYALVVDRIRTAVRFLCVDNDGNAGAVNPDVFQFIVDTVDDLVNTLECEDPFHGTLLRTTLVDRVPRNDGRTDYPIRACSEILSALTELFQFQFVVNEVLHDLYRKEPLAPEKYDGLWELPVTEILNAEGTLTSRYHFRSAVDYYHFLLLHFVTGKPNVALCECCGRYFIPKTKKKTLYCDRILKDDKTCKEWGPTLKHRQAAQNKNVIEEFDRAKRRMYKRYERTTYLSKRPSEKDLSYAEYYEWLEKATEARDAYLTGELSEEDALRIIVVP